VHQVDSDYSKPRLTSAAESGSNDIQPIVTLDALDTVSNGLPAPLPLSPDDVELADATVVSEDVDKEDVVSETAGAGDVVIGGVVTCEVVTSDVVSCTVDDGSVVNVASVAVDGVEVEKNVCTVDVSAGGVLVAEGMMLKLPTLLVVVVVNVDVVRLVVDVLLGAKVKSSSRHSSKMRLPRCAE